MKAKVCISGVHGTGKSKICEKIIDNILSKDYFSKESYECCGISQQERYVDISIEHNLAFIPEQFREVVKDIPDFHKQTEKITLATYAKQLYLENLYTAQGKNILCDRSVYDAFIYYEYFNNKFFRERLNLPEGETNMFSELDYENDLRQTKPRLYKQIKKMEKFSSIAFDNLESYDKIYLVEPSDREIENDGFRLTDKKEQLEVHKAFLRMFKSSDNVEIINQEEAHKEEFIEKVVNEFNS